MYLNQLKGYGEGADFLEKYLSNLDMTSHEYKCVRDLLKFLFREAFKEDT